MSVIILYRLGAAAAPGAPTHRPPRALPPMLLTGSPASRRAGALRLLKRVVRWRERARQRRALANLDWRLLRDIGLTAEQALLEANKPFWR